LTELTHAAARPKVRAALDQLLATRLPELLETSLADVTGALPTILDLALTQAPQPATAATLLERLPERSTALAVLAATLTSQAVDQRRHELRAGTEESRTALAGALLRHSYRLADLGRREDALAAIEEAVQAYRQLADACPDAFLPDLAGSLNNLAPAGRPGPAGGRAGRE
jgi:tetratricopeptide (TPR) repeat protein